MVRIQKPICAIVALSAMLTSFAAQASDYIPLNPSTIRGKTILLDEGSSLEYRANGIYVYTLGGRSQQGTWRIGANGAVCVDFPNGRGRCDFYLENGSSLFLRNSYGKLFKVRFAQ
ncbi:MAG: hypothetical protein HY242_05840 [Afipia sp.]|nr:hypothetical protein [Afipia sp.]